MGSPTCVGDTYRTRHILVTAIFRQIIYLAFCLIDIQLIVAIDKCHTSRVISSIFKAPKTLNQNGEGFFLSNISYYSTHTLLCLVRFFGCKSTKKLANSMRVSQLFLSIELEIVLSVVVADVFNHLAQQFAVVGQQALLYIIA